MSLWKRIADQFAGKDRKTKRDNQTPDPDDVDYGDRINNPNSFTGRAAGNKWVGPQDPRNPASPFSPFKKDRF